MYFYILRNRCFCTKRLLHGPIPVTNLLPDLPYRVIVNVSMEIMDTRAMNTIVAEATSQISDSARYLVWWDRPDLEMLIYELHIDNFLTKTWGFWQLKTSVLLICTLKKMCKWSYQDTRMCNLYTSSKSLVMQWLNCCTAAKTVLTTRSSIPGSRLKVDSAFYPSEVGKMSTQPAGRAKCSLHN